jgi:hypothetical protein
MNRVTPVAIVVVLCAVGCRPQEEPQRSDSGRESASKPTETPVVGASAPAPPIANAESRAEAPCSEEPSQPEKLRDVPADQGVAAEFNKLFETGRFQMGYCLAEVRVTANGTVDAVRLLRPKDADTRVQSAIVRTITSWKYKPAIACGRPVPSTTSVGFFHCPFKAERGRDPGD